MNRVAQFRADFPGAISRAIDKDPERFAKVVARHGSKEAAVEKLTAAMNEMLDKRHGTSAHLGLLGGWIIDSPSLRILAKQRGIKNTYKAWDAYLGRSSKQEAA